MREEVASQVGRILDRLSGKVYRDCKTVQFGR
jgi:hypothetical protein